MRHTQSTIIPFLPITARDLSFTRPSSAYYSYWDWNLKLNSELPREWWTQSPKFACSLGRWYWRLANSYKKWYFENWWNWPHRNSSFIIMRTFLKFLLKVFVHPTFAKSSLRLHIKNINFRMRVFLLSSIFFTLSFSQGIVPNSWLCDWMGIEGASSALKTKYKTVGLHVWIRFSSRYRLFPVQNIPFSNPRL